MNPVEFSNDVPDAGRLAVTDRLGRRPWPATLIRPGIEVSFEFFPPNTPAGDKSLFECVEKLAPFGPSFVSVTYGAGGSTQERTLATLERLTTTTDLAVAGHLTCVGATKNLVHGVIDSYLKMGVRRIVALRGDAPEGSSDGTVDGGFQTAADLVAAIRARDDDIDISVAAYPEVHPKATSPSADLDNLKRKLDAGADRALTQFFFDTDAFLRFRDSATKAGITKPIVPGIMPVPSFERVASFAAKCGTIIPEWMPQLFDGLEDMPDVHQLVSATLAAEQCRRLAENGVNEFHFYTMNKPQLSAATCQILGVRPQGLIDDQPNSADSVRAC
ncbi:MAG: methylenetetrahydrofolate reductase [NAD(P)H] [Acidimicrobiales bacterium]